MDFQKVIGNLPKPASFVAQVFDAVFTTVSNALRVEEVDPLSQHYDSDTLDEVSSGTDAIYSYYIDMNSFRKCGFQILGSAGAAPGTITVTVEGTMQDDGTAPELCTYDDITNDTFGATSFVINTTLTDIITLNDNTEKLALYKYVKLLLNVASGANDGSWTVYHMRLY